MKKEKLLYLWLTMVIFAFINVDMISAQSSDRNKIPVSAELYVGTGKIPISNTDPAHTVQLLEKNPPISLDVTFSDGSTVTALDYDYQNAFAENIIFDDVSGDPNDLIKIVWWDRDAKRPHLGKFAGQLTSTGKGVGSAVLKASFRNAPQLTASVRVEVVSGASGTLKSELDFMNDWISVFKKKLPLTIKGVKLNDALAYCPDGCDPNNSSISYIELTGDTPGITTGERQTEAAESINPVLLQEYCKSGLDLRNITLRSAIFIKDNYNTYYKIFYPEDCGKKSTTIAPILGKIPVSANLTTQSDSEFDLKRIQIPVSYDDAAYNIKELRMNPPIYLDVTFTDGTQGVYDYKIHFSDNIIFDDVSADPNDLIEISWWEKDYLRPEKGVYAAQITSTGNGTGTATLLVSFRNAPHVTSALTVEVVSGASAAPNKFAFITSRTYSGSLGGVTGADYKCQAHADKAGLKGKYKAWIADDSSSPWTRFDKSLTPYIMTNGIPLAANWRTLTTTPLGANFDIDEYGERHVSAGAWTGTDNGRKMANCQGWKTKDAGKEGSHGCSSTKDSRWGRTICGLNGCDNRYRLYCFEQ